MRVMEQAGLRLEPGDEYMHPLEDDSTFNESMYFNFYDPERRLGGFLRLGNRANEGYAEMTVCLYLPDGRVAFAFSRPEISSNDWFDAGGMRFEVVKPFEALRAGFSGRVALLDDPLAMRDPRAALTAAPWVECSIDLNYRGISPMLGGEPIGDGSGQVGSGLASSFARGHYEQHVGALGRVGLDGVGEWPVDGYGLRDHSWGPRTWQAPRWYRWLTCNAGERDGFMVAIVAGPEDTARSGVLLRAGSYEPIIEASLETDWTEGEMLHRGLRCRARTAERELEITGEVGTLVPLRNRRGGAMTRIGEGLTTYRWDGLTGYGLSEYLDQIDDGRPTGA